MKKEIYQALAKAGSSYWWNQGRQDLVARLVERFRPNPADSKAELRLLDVGCAAGGTLSGLSRWGEVWGLDISSEAIALCLGQGIPAGHLLLGAAENMPQFQAGQFDVVTAVEVLEHLARPEAALAEIRRVLQPNGILIMTAPADQRLWSSRDERCGHWRRYSLQGLGSELAAAGFEVLLASYANVFYYWPFRWLVHWRSALNARAEIATDTLDVRPWLNGLFAWWLKQENAWLLRGIRWPWGVSAVCVAQKKMPR